MCPHDVYIWGMTEHDDVPASARPAVRVEPEAHALLRRLKTRHPALSYGAMIEGALRCIVCLDDVAVVSQKFTPEDN